MESKVTVLTPNGRRQIVKVTPNTTILKILEDVCQKQGFSSDEYCLKRNNNEVTLSDTFFYSNLPNNCLLEMSETNKKRVAKTVDICVQAKDGTRKKAQFVPDDNLWHVLKRLLGESELDRYESPVIIYLRQEVLGREQLTIRTLKSLGILEGAVFLRLLDKQPEELKTQAMVYKPPAPKAVSTPTEVEEDKPTPSKTVVPGGSGFAITKDLVQSLKKTTNNEAKYSNTDEINEELARSSNTTESPKYDWGSAPGRSLRNPEIQMEVDTICNEPEIEPEYHILGERNALIYWLESAQSPVEDLPDSFYDLSVNDLKLILRDLKKTREGDTYIQAKNNTMLRKISEYKNCAIRIQFPDRYVLQGMFKPIDKLTDVKEFIKNYLEEPEKSFHLFTIPPKKILDLNKTLLELDFVPNALVHFSLEDETDNTEHFIKPTFLKKLTPPEGASYLASKLRKQQHILYSKPEAAEEPSRSTGAIPKRPRQ